MTAFINGRELSRRFYSEVIRPLLQQHFSQVPHAAAHLGSGSDVLGFDTSLSRDHDWNPTVYILLRDADAHHAETIRASVDAHLPPTFAGYPTRISLTGADSVQHRVYVMTPRAYLWQHLRWDIDQPLTTADWLSFPSQLLRVIQAGAVHHDDVGEWSHLRERLRWYPHDVWLYLMAASWQRISQEEHLYGRAGSVGDVLGSPLIVSRLVRDAMRLVFLQERVYAPYSKWFGTAFQQLASADDLTPHLRAAQAAQSWQAAETALMVAFAYLAEQHNALGVTEPIDTAPQPFFTRPFRVITHNGIVDALMNAITPPLRQQLRRLPGLIGGIDHFSDSTDLRSHIAWRQRVKALYLPAPDDE